MQIDLLFRFLSTIEITYYCTAIVGLVLLITGIAKAVDSSQFISHVQRYRLLPHYTWAPRFAIVFIAVECALGVALILYVFPQWLIPGVILLLVGLSALTFWSTTSSRTEDCGCYGGLLVIPPNMSLLLNGCYILLLVQAWLHPVNHSTPIWQWVVSLVVFVCAGAMARYSRYKPIVDLSYLKPGNRWKRNWLKNSSLDFQQGTYLIAFLSPNCVYCKQWLPILNSIHDQQNIYQVVGAMFVPDEELEKFKAEHNVRFALVRIDKLLLAYMVNGFPTGILLTDGKINHRWQGSFPKELLGITGLKMPIPQEN